MAQFKDIFAELRKDTGLSQEKFAEIFHQSGSAISSYETGRNAPSYEILIQYADYFNVTTDYLIGRTPHNISPTVLVEDYVDGTTVKDVIDLLRSLPTNRRRALLLLLEDLRFSVSIQGQANQTFKGE